MSGRELEDWDASWLYMKRQLFTPIFCDCHFQPSLASSILPTTPVAIIWTPMSFFLLSCRHLIYAPGPNTQCRFTSGLYLNYPRSLARERVAQTTPLCTLELLSMKKENMALRLTKLCFLIYWPGKTFIIQHQFNIQNWHSIASTKLTITQHNSDCLPLVSNIVNIAW
jgi:hypothetical protein